MQYSQLILLAILIVGFYLLFVRPQQQQAKRQRQMVDNLSVGDEIVTIGGIYGRVIVPGEKIRIAIADGSELEIAPRAVSAVLNPIEVDDDEDEEEDEEIGSEEPGA